MYNILVIQKYKNCRKVFNSNKYLVTFSLVHLLTSSVVGPAAVSKRCRGCCINSKQTVVFSQEDTVLVNILRQ